MTRVEPWIALLAAVSFLAGVPAGVLLARGMGPSAAPSGPFADYAARLSSEFDLEPERRRALRVVLDDYHRALDEIRSRQLGVFEDEIVRQGRLCRERIRDYVLPAAARPRFDQLAAALVGPVGPVGPVERAAAGRAGP